MEKQRLDNLLGALSLSLMDRIDRAISDRTGFQGTAIFALVLLSQTPSLTIDALAKLLQLAHSSAVRLVERLVEEGHVERQPGTDKRTVVLALTDTGRTVVLSALSARAEAIANVTAALPNDARLAMVEICEKLLTSMSPDATTSARNCRLCNEGACDLKRCPVDIVYRVHLGQDEK